MSAPGVRTVGLDAVAAAHAHSLMDVLYRRLGRGRRHAFTGGELDAARRAMATETGWTEAERSQAIAAFRAERERPFRPGTAR